MAKKSTPAKRKKAPAQTKAKAKKSPPAKSGMWKILERKQAHHKEMEQARSEGQSHAHHGPGHEFHATVRDPRFSKFAGPRRKAG